MLSPTPCYELSRVWNCSTPLYHPIGEDKRIIRLLKWDDTLFFTPRDKSKTFLLIRFAGNPFNMGLTRNKQQGFQISETASR